MSTSILFSGDELQMTSNAEQVSRDGPLGPRGPGPRVPGPVPPSAGGAQTLAVSECRWRQRPGALRMLAPGNRARGPCGETISKN